MSRNPHATNLRHHKPKRIEDKRSTVTECRGWEISAEEWNDAEPVAVARYLLDTGRDGSDDHLLEGPLE